MDRAQMYHISRFTAKTVTAIMAVILLANPLSVYADNDAQVYYIPQESILAWRYWMNHITDNDIEHSIGYTDGSLYGHVTSTVTYHTANMTTEEKNMMYASLQGGGCTWNSSGTDISATCPRLASSGIYSSFQEQNVYTLEHEIPWMTGTITQPSAYASGDRIYVTSGLEYMFAFYCTQNISSNDLVIYYSDGTSQTATRANSGISSIGQMMIYRWTNTDSSKWGTISISALNGVTTANISPIYYGRTANCPDDIREVLNVPTRTVEEMQLIDADIISVNDSIEYMQGQISNVYTRLGNINQNIITMNTNLGTKLDTVNTSIGTMNTNLGNKLNSVYDRQNTVMNSINANIDEMDSNIGSKIDGTNSRLSTITTQLREGNASSQQSVAGNNQTTSEIITSSGSFMEKEDSAIDDMETGLSSINTTSSDLLRSSKFIASANWVTTQFTRLVTDTPFELLIYFSLVLGLALVFIRKVE